MSNDKSRRVTITVRVPVTLTVDAAMQGGEVTVVAVQNVLAPDADEVMAALDADEQFEELDRLYEEAGTGAAQ